MLPEDQAPVDWESETGWRCIQVRGPLAFDQVGILASLTAPLAQAAIPVFALSTYETDYLLVKDPDLPRAREALTDAGHVIESTP